MSIIYTIITYTLQYQSIKHTIYVHVQKLHNSVCSISWYMLHTKQETRKYPYRNWGWKQIN